MSQDTEIYLYSLLSISSAAEAVAEAARLNNLSLSDLMPMILELAEKDLKEG